MLKYETLSAQLSEQMAREKRARSYVRRCCENEAVIRRREVSGDHGSVWRPPFVHDVDKIIHCPYYNRYADKTQVFSLIRNDDVTAAACTCSWFRALPAPSAAR